MKETIKDKLKEIETCEKVRVLHCVESGSRAWGFASPDSDYDVRFIYVRPTEYYLRLEKTRDLIEWQLDETLDINCFTLSQNEFCCPEEVVRFYIALRKNGFPVYIYDGVQIEKYLSGEGKIGIIPCFDESWEYFYGGFDDKDVGEFINLPDEPCDELIERITWEKIPAVRLIGEQ